MSSDEAPKNVDELEGLEGELELAYAEVRRVDAIFAGGENDSGLSFLELDQLRDEALATIRRIEKIIGKHSVYGRS